MVHLHYTEKPKASRSVRVKTFSHFSEGFFEGAPTASRRARAETRPQRHPYQLNVNPGRELRRILFSRLGGDEENGDLPRITREKAALMLFGCDAGSEDPLAYRGDLLLLFEHYRPVAQANPALRGGRHALSAPDVEPEVVMGHAHVHVAIEAEAPLQVADVQVNMADSQPGAGLIARLFAGNGSQQAVLVEGVRTAGVLQSPGPALARAVGGKFDAVAVGVGKVHSLVGAVVGGALYPGSRRREAQRRVRQLLAGGEEQRVVVEASMPPRPSRSRLLVQDEKFLFANTHRCRRVLAAVQAQSHGFLVESYRAAEVRNRQVHTAEAERRWELRQRGVRDDLFVLVHVDTPCISSPRWASNTSRKDRGGRPVRNSTASEASPR